jgi:pyridoxal phosphate enzyme (YggS family)
MTIADNLTHITQRIRSAAVTAGRDPSLVRLVAVSKTRPPADIMAACRAGQLLFGENYVQELVTKAAQVTAPVQWHMIGHLQSNKVKHVAGLVSLVHSLDRLSLAQEISRRWSESGRVCDALIQVNIAGEATKGGTSEQGALELARFVSRLPGIRIRGLMTMPPFFDDPERSRPCFRRLRHLAEEIAAAGIEGVEMTELSMGMSGDFEVAVQEGATLVRVGTAIFGER